LNLNINGQIKEFSEEIITLEDLLLNLNIKKLDRVAVEINKEIIELSVFDQTAVCSNDCIEIVSFVGGG